jgi:hypothetical protein
MDAIQDLSFFEGTMDGQPSAIHCLMSDNLQRVNFFPKVTGVGSRIALRIRQTWRSDVPNNSANFLASIIPKSSAAVIECS